MKIQNLKLAKTLIKEGYLDKVKNLSKQGEISMQLLVRDFLSENNQEFLFSLLKKMEEFQYQSVVDILNLGGIIEPTQRQKNIDQRLGLSNPGIEYQYKNLETLEAEFDKYASEQKFPESDWATLTFLQKKTKKEAHEKESKKSIKTDSLEEILSRRIERKLRRTEDGFYVDKRGRVYNCPKVGLLRMMDDIYGRGDE